MEADMFGDIIQEDFIDSWKNLTIKFDQNCNLDHHLNHIKYVMKVDEDVYVNMPKLEKMLLDHSGPNLLMGHLACDPNPKEDDSYEKLLKTIYKPKYHNGGE